MSRENKYNKKKNDPIKRALKSRFPRSSNIFRGLSQGSRVLVQFQGSSYRLYDGDPSKPPKREVVYVLTADPEYDIDDVRGPKCGTNYRAEVVAENKSTKRATLYLRPVGEHANTIILLNRNADGHHTTGSWVHLTEAPTPSEETTT